MKNYRFHIEQFIPRSVDQVFAFFSQAENLEHITPPWLRFRIITPVPIDMHLATCIVYRLKLYGIPVNWKTEISAWEPPFRFVDIQISGPYTLWVHEHRFEQKDHGTMMYDTVVYNFRAGFLRPLVNRLFVAKRVHRIFAYRRNKIQELLG